MPIADDPWDAHAGWWQREFTEGADPEYVEQILPLIASRLPEKGVVVDVGCGDGQVMRLADPARHHTVGFDASGAQLLTAVDRCGPRVGQASATALPLPDGVVDLAVVSLVLEHVPDVRSALDELARILAPGGRLLLLLNHPLLQTPDSGWIDDHILDPPEQYWRIGAYLVEAETVEEVEPGVHIRFHHRPLSTYFNRLADAGLRLVRMDEPAPPPGFLARSPEYAEAAHVPRLLALELERPGH